MAQFSLSHRDAIVRSHHAPAVVAIRIAHKFFDETLRRCAQVGAGRIGSRRADLPEMLAVAV
jgi:hypothetical protein